MDDQLANLIANKVTGDIRFWTAWVGFAGVVVGSVITIIGNILLHIVREKPQKQLDIARKKLLSRMLNNPEFKEGRSLETLSKVTGAEPEDCRRLLIELGARGFTLKIIEKGGPTKETGR